MVISYVFQAVISSHHEAVLGLEQAVAVVTIETETEAETAMQG